jgi:hypothetical protein
VAVVRHSKTKMFKLLTLFFITLIGNVTFAQRTDTFSISGKAISKYSGEPIRGASIIIDKNSGTTFDTAGRFSISGLNRGTYKLSFHCIDFKRKDTVITLQEKSIQNLVLNIATDCKYYNHKKAINDIKHKKTTLFVESQPDPKVDNLFRTKYGVQLQFNNLRSPTDDCIAIYNNTVAKHLDKTFGKEWRDDLKVKLIGMRGLNERTTFAIGGRDAHFMSFLFVIGQQFRLKILY